MNRTQRLSTEEALPATRAIPRSPDQSDKLERLLSQAWNCAILNTSCQSPCGTSHSLGITKWHEQPGYLILNK